MGSRSLNYEIEMPVNQRASFNFSGGMGFDSEENF